MGAPITKHLDLEVEHIEVLQRNLQLGTIEHRIAKRSRILLLRAQGLGAGAIAEKVGCGRATVYRVQDRYEARGLDGLHDLPRPGRPPNFSPSAGGADHRAGVLSAS